MKGTSMNEVGIRSFSLSYIDALNARAFHEMDRFVADEIAFGTQPYPREAVVGSLAEIIDAVPDFRWEVEDILVDGDRLAVRLLNAGTPTKEWNGTAHAIRARETKISIGAATLAVVPYTSAEV